MRAVGQDMEVARAAGIRVEHTRIISVVISTIFSRLRHDSLSSKHRHIKYLQLPYANRHVFNCCSFSWRSNR